MSSIEKILDTAYTGGYGPQQRRAEIRGLAQILQSNPPRRILEIGSATGGSLYIFSRVATWDACLWSVDNRPEILYRPELVREGQTLVTSLPPLSPLPSNIDFLFIDADHRYESVKNDYERYSPLVRKGGLIGFHDINEDRGPTGNSQVKVFWDEIKKQFLHLELREDSRQDEMGIGLLWV